MKEASPFRFLVSFAFFFWEIKIKNSSSKACSHGGAYWAIRLNSTVWVDEHKMEKLRLLSPTLERQFSPAWLWCSVGLGWTAYPQSFLSRKWISASVLLGVGAGLPLLVSHLQSGVRWLFRWAWEVDAYKKKKKEKSWESLDFCQTLKST